MPQTFFDDPGRKVKLDDISAEPPDDVTHADAKKRFATLGAQLFDLQDAMWGAKLHSVLVVLQGRDGAGKDGAIKHVMGSLNPRGVNVVSFGVPTKEESEHDFLWRVHRHAPRLGEFAIFNRSHYEDVLVVRVHGLAPKKLWKARYDDIANFEALLARHNTLVLKYFLHITKQEQKKRLLEREAQAETAWKVNVNDWIDREHWGAYTDAYEDAISKTAAKHAPWTIVPANAKWYRDLVIAESIAAALAPHRDEWLAKLNKIGKEAKAAVHAYRRQ